MSTHAEPQKEELKKHGDVLDKVVKSSDEHGNNAKNQPAPSGKNKE